ncbi:MAG: metallopeptidase family protein [Azospirillaceae bacterium]
MSARVTAPDLDEMTTMAEAALESLPAELVGLVRGVAIRVVDFPDEDTLAEMGLESPFDLLGLYSGVPFGEAETAFVRQQPDMIFLYRRPILDYWCDTGEPLDHVVRHVLIHEIGHHFGFSDEDMEAIEASAE